MDKKEIVRMEEGLKRAELLLNTNLLLSYASEAYIFNSRILCVVREALKEP